jgi:uncharacterized protein (TIGR02453 family)
MADGFRGFDRDAVAFLHELAAEQNREWFAANKERYEQRWVAPMTALLEDIRRRTAKAYGPVKLSPPKLFRIYRDTRFAKDKSPYKTHVAGMIRAGSSSALYLHIGIDEEWVGVGTYFFEPTQLPRWRKLVAADATGKPLAALIGKLRKAGYRVGGHDDYKRVPKGFAPDHRRAELLKMKGLTGGFPDLPAGMLHRPELADWLVRHVKATAPLVVWLARHVK